MWGGRLPRIALLLTFATSIVTTAAWAQSSPEGEAKARLDAAKVEFERLQAEADPVRQTYERAKEAWEQKSAQLEQAKRAVAKAASEFEAAKSAAALAKGGFKAGMVFRDCPDCPEMVVIPTGSFMMGSPKSDKDASSAERPQHQVTITAPFALGKYPVTQAEWFAVMGNNPSHFSGANRPVEQVSWNDVQEFIRRLNVKTGKNYRLPSDAEWEYAARAGTTTRYYWGDQVGQGNANCNGCGSRWDYKETSPVGSFRPNRFGLFDMAGNVSEWTADCWYDSYQGAPTDGGPWLGPSACGRGSRGGNWYDSPIFSRPAHHGWARPTARSYMLGFRLAKTLP